MVREIHLGGMCGPSAWLTGAARAAERGPIRAWHSLHIGAATLPGACQLGMAGVASSLSMLRSCASRPQRRLPAPVSGHDILIRPRKIKQAPSPGMCTKQFEDRDLLLETHRTVFWHRIVWRVLTFIALLTSGWELARVSHTAILKGQ